MLANCVDWPTSFNGILENAVSTCLVPVYYAEAAPRRYYEDPHFSFQLFYLTLDVLEFVRSAVDSSIVINIENCPVSLFRNEWTSTRTA